MPEVFIEIADCFGRNFGTPLPKHLLRIGDVNHQWHITLNPTKEPIDSIQPFTAHVQWFGFPAGIIDPGGRSDCRRGTGERGKPAGLAERAGLMEIHIHLIDWDSVARAVGIVAVCVWAGYALWLTEK